MVEHKCPGPNCTIMVPQHQLGCPKHWYSVSQATRSRVWRAYRDSSNDHAAAVAQAIEEMYR